MSFAWHTFEYACIHVECWIYLQYNKRTLKCFNTVFILSIYQIFHIILLIWIYRSLFDSLLDNSRYMRRQKILDHAVSGTPNILLKLNT